jgi:penicillin-binding protein 1A
VGRLEGDGWSCFAANPPRPYVAGLTAAGAGDELLPDVSYVGAVVELPVRGGVVLAVGRHRLAMKADDGRHLRNWRGKVEKGPRPTLAIGDLVPVRALHGARGETELSLAQLPDVQAAMVAVDQRTGRVEALVGGYDFRTNQFNRVTQARRQIGSAIKPFIYATAMMHGVSALDVYSDSPVAVATASGIWSPSNYDGDYLGPVTVRTAMSKSLNTVAVRLLLGVGVEAVIETMRAVGIRSPIPHHVSIALGTPDLTLLEATAGYGVFANGGKLLEGQDGRPGEPPGRFVELVTKPDGTILADYRRRLPQRQVIEPELAFLMTDLLRAPVERGTAKRAQELARPAAGKTGTSTGWRDAWFIGYTNDRLAGVWIGRDDFTPIGTKATGGTSALPIWVQFMKSAHPETPATDFPVPPGVTLVRANEMTGQPLPPGSPGARWVPFARGTVPTRFATAIKSSEFADAGDLDEPIDDRRRQRP